MNGINLAADTNFLISVHKGKPETEPFLDSTFIVSEIKNLAIEIRQNIQVKTPDAIIAATAKFLKLPLITSDRGFTKLKDIEIILL